MFFFGTNRFVDPKYVEMEPTFIENMSAMSPHMLECGFGGHLGRHFEFKYDKVIKKIANIDF